jgi:lipid-binding SYLF domain-containing protein
MMKVRLFGSIFALVILVAVALAPQAALADTAEGIDRGVELALEKLYESSTAAKELSKVAKGILVFPKVRKAGLVVGGQFGEGALLKDGETVGYYSTAEASYGLQAGAQTFGYALFFVTDSALENFENSAGFEVGVGPTIVVVDEGLSRSLTTTTLKDDIYAFFFGQKGLMGGLGLKGSKITKITPSEE